MKEALLEKTLRRMRLARIAPWVKENDQILDVGCGWQALALRHFAPKIKRGVGLDFKVEKVDVPTNLTLLTERFDREWPIQEKEFDKALMLAVLEHIEPERVSFVLGNIRKSLKATGKLVLTVPTPRGKPVLEFLAFKVGVVSPDEIRDHKVYYDKGLLATVLGTNGFKLVEYKTFQLGMNSFAVAEPIPSK